MTSGLLNGSIENSTRQRANRGLRVGLSIAVLVTAACVSDSVPNRSQSAEQPAGATTVSREELIRETFSNRVAPRMKKAALFPTNATGKVTSCFGSQCPSGECDAAPAVGELGCIEVYDQLITDLNALCPAIGNTSFCLNLEDGQGDWLWAVKCSGGVASSNLCNREDGSSACESMLSQQATCG